MKDIKGFEGIYSVTKEGKIWSYPKNHGFYDTKGGFIKGVRQKSGYIMHTLHRGGKPYPRLGHRLIAEALIPNPEKYPCVNHIDGNPSNNSLENLEWCTYSMNTRHAFKIGRMKVGEEHPNAILTEEKVRRIREIGKTRLLTHKEIAKFYDIDRTTVSKIIQGILWSHLV